MGRKKMKLSYEEFCDEFTKAVYEAAKSVSGVTSVVPRELFKSNRGLTEGLSLELTGMNIAPIIYPYDAYENYCAGEHSIIRLAEEMVEWAVSAAHSGISIDLSGICPENASESLYLQILNGKKNRGAAEETAHLKLHDLIAVPRWKINGGSILCNRDFQKDLLKLSDEELLETALSNTLRCDFTITGLTEYLCGISDYGAPLFEERMYLVLGNDYISGAAALFSEKMLQKICLVVEDENFYVIPSSVNEIIAVPQWAVDDPEDLKSICREVNHSVVSTEDFLSDNIYKYESATGKLSSLESE